MNDTDELLKAGEYLLDVRENFEYDMGHVSQAKHIPLQELSHRLEELPADKTIFTYCKSGRRSETAAELLKAYGFNAFSLNDGFSTNKGQFTSIETRTDYSASSSKVDH